MVRKFVERLIAEFNGTKADLRVALGPGRMKLPHCKYRFPITLLIKGDDHPEPARIVKNKGDADHVFQRYRTPFGQ